MINSTKEDILKEFDSLKGSLPEYRGWVPVGIGKDFLSQSLDRIEQQVREEREETIKKALISMGINLVCDTDRKIAIETLQKITSQKEEEVCTCGHNKQIHANLRCEEHCFAIRCKCERFEKEEGMNDLLPFEHGQDGTHNACQAMLDKYGAQVECCTCTGHKCKEGK